MGEKYNILRERFCIYCQLLFTSPPRLQRHVLSKHKDTYAANSILRARKEAKVR